MDLWIHLRREGRLLGFFLLLASGLVWLNAPGYAGYLRGDLTSLLWKREVPALQNGETRWQNYESLRLYVSEGPLTATLNAHLRKLGTWDSRLFQGYLNWSQRGFRLRVGRQFLPNDVGFWQMDGVRAGARWRMLRWDLYGGSAITPWGQTRSRVAGVDVRLTRTPLVNTRGNAVLVFNGDGVQRLILGGQLGVGGASLPGVHRTADLPVQVFGRFNVDVLSRQLVSGWAYLGLGTSRARWYAQYRQETPLFPEDSIFSVFAVEPLKEASVGVGVQPWDGITLAARYARQFYESGPLHRYRMGVYLGPFASFLERIDNDRVAYWRTYSQVRLNYGPLQARLSHYYNNYRKAALSAFETAYSYQLQLRYFLGRNLTLSVRVEDNVNPDFKYNVRALGSIRWGFRHTF